MKTPARDSSEDFPFDATDPELRAAYRRGVQDGKFEGVQLINLAISDCRTLRKMLISATASSLLFNRSEKVSHAARRIGVPRRTLYRHMRRIEAKLRGTPHKT